MISLRPFRAWRPVPDKAHLVGSRSFVSYSPRQLSEKLARDPYTYLHVIHPDGMVPEELSRNERFQRVRQAFQSFCDKGILLRDEVPCLYVYEQSSEEGARSCGVIAGVGVHDYQEGRIKVHEHTLTAREQLFAEYLLHTGVNAEPVLLASPEDTPWEHLLSPVTATRPDNDFSTTDGLRHRLWVVSDPKVQEEFQQAFARIPSLYIADGHHRMASSARLVTGRQATEASPKGWCLAFIVPQKDLHIHNFDRVVKDLGDMDEDAFLRALSTIGRIEAVEKPHTAPGTMALCTGSGWHLLHLPPAGEGLSPTERLDCARLSALVLAPLLGIKDLRSDGRVAFVPGTHGTQELERMVNSGEAAVAFHLHPVDFTELRAVADSGGIMPPKSTWIEPKLRSGLVVYPLDDA